MYHFGNMLVVLFLFVGHIQLALAQTGPKIFDFSGIYSPDSGGQPSTKIALSGYNPAPMLWQYDLLNPNPPMHVQITYDWQHNNNKYMAIYMHDKCAPLDPNSVDKNCLIKTLNWLHANSYGLHYVFPDFETSTDILANVKEVIRIIRSYPDPKINTAKISQYNYYPGLYNYFTNYPKLNIMDRRSGTTYGNGGHIDFYLSGINVLSPPLYPFASDLVHATNTWAKGAWIDPATGKPSTFSLVSPNQRSAFFWSSLEKISTVRRNTTQETIPYISSIIQQSGYSIQSGQEPTEADYNAALQHYRFRGISGFITFDGGSMDYTKYRNNMLSTWRSMDDFFNKPGSTYVLNTSTNCTGGIEWSAVQKKNRVLGIISNLNTTQEINWSAQNVLSLPKKSPRLSQNTHLRIQYHTHYMQSETMKYLPQFFGPNASRWQLTAQSTLVPVSGSYNNTEAWFRFKSTNFSATDKVSYSAMFLYKGSGIKFFPVNTAGANIQTIIPWSHSGPAFMITRDAQNNFQFRFRANPVNNPTYQSVNATPQIGRWYEVRIEINPTPLPSGSAKIYLRDVSSGNRDYDLLVWNDVNTAATERVLDVPLQLASTRNPSNFDGWQIYATDASTQFDNFSAGYSVPNADDNFNHYAPEVTLDKQGWFGATPQLWKAKGGSISPIAGGYNISAWRGGNLSAFDAKDAVVYSAKLNPGNAGYVGFSPINTAGANIKADLGDGGPFFSIRTDQNKGFRIRAVQVNFDNYKATRVPVAGHAYEIQMIVDPTRTHASGYSGRYGVARVYVRDVTLNEGFTPLLFKNETRAGTSILIEVPIGLHSKQNPTNFNGWQVYGINSNVQVDNLKSFLYPFKDFNSGGAVTADMIGPAM